MSNEQLFRLCKILERLCGPISMSLAASLTTQRRREPCQDHVIDFAYSPTIDRCIIDAAPPASKVSRPNADIISCKWRSKPAAEDL